MAFDEEPVDNTMICCFSVFCKNNNGMVFLAVALLIHFGFACKGFDAGNGNVVTIGVFLLPFLECVLVFSGFVISGV